jgi:hypothetical protein
MTKPRTCKIGLTPVEKTARRDWNSAQKKRKRGTTTNLQSIPPPPMPGTPAAVKCNPTWALAVQEAKYLDLLADTIANYRLIVSQLLTYRPIPQAQVNYWNKKIATLQQEYRMKQAGLTAQKQAYTDCMKGFRV